tara:strand:+ start:242 stop:496 length:255 start_codon:yes stop_codon:yes gene_type:complete
MQTIYQEVIVTNELPRIGSGYRLVKVQIGNKWVYISDLDGENRTKVGMKTWSAIKKGNTIEPEVILKSLRKADRALGRKARRKL